MYRHIRPTVLNLTKSKKQENENKISILVIWNVSAGSSPDGLSTPR